MKRTMFINGNVGYFLSKKDNMMHRMDSIKDLLECFESEEKVIEYIKENNFEFFK